MKLKCYFTQSQNGSILIRLQISIIILLLCVIAAPWGVAQSEIHYSDQWADDSVEDELRAVGVGITEADYQSGAESYTVETTLRSPDGETASVTSDGFWYAQAEVVMPWYYDWGDWFVSSSHSGIFNECNWDYFIGNYRCYTHRRFLELTSYYLGYYYQSSQFLWYRYDGVRPTKDHCAYTLCAIHEDSFCAQLRSWGIIRKDGGGTNNRTCPAGYERDFDIISVGDYRMFCWKTGERFLSYNPC